VTNICNEGKIKEFCLKIVNSIFNEKKQNEKSSFLFLSNVEDFKKHRKKEGHRSFLRIIKP
jgi:hypothetical protein